MFKFGRMVKLEDTRDLGSRPERGGGSTPPSPTSIDCYQVPVVQLGRHNELKHRSCGFGTPSGDTRQKAEWWNWQTQRT